MGGANPTCRCSTRRTHWSTRGRGAYGHVIVDEAQDLTPMQLRMVARRAPSGSLTLLGDIAQATGPVTYRRWEELLRLLPGGDEGALEELRHAYRVPREIMEFALPLLDVIAPDVEPPLAFRTGGAAPSRRRVRRGRLAPAAFERGRALGARGGLLAVIAPGRCCSSRQLAALALRRRASRC